MLFTLVLALAQAANPQARLAFSSDASACPESHLREAVAARLGYDPFVAEAPLGVSVRISAGPSLRAQVRVTRPDSAEAVRTLSGPPDCQALINSVALALAVAVDPLVLARPAPAPTDVKAESAKPAEPAATPAEPSVTQANAAAPPAEPLRLALCFGGGADLNQQPEGTAGFQVGARYGGKLLSGVADALVTLPSRLRLDDMGGGVETFFIGADGGVCASVSLFSGCALARLGAMRYQGFGFGDVRQGWLLSLSAGARVAVEWPKESTVAVQASGELRVPIVRPRLLLGDEVAWEQPWVIGGGGLALLVRVP